MPTGGAEDGGVIVPAGATGVGGESDWQVAVASGVLAQSASSVVTESWVA